jgi:hypothetical protein
MVRWLQDNGYHPRSNKHGKALCGFLLEDLLDGCPMFRKLAASGKIVWKGDLVVNPDSDSQWTVDLVVGPPEDPPLTEPGDGQIAEGIPRDIWIAVDAKSTMTEFGKARRNRARDLNSFQDIMHNNNPKTVAGGLMMLNIAERFKSPLRPNITVHRNIGRLVDETLAILRGLTRARQESTQRGIEAVGAVVVNHTNVKGDTTTLANVPTPGDAVNYGKFVRDLCEFFTNRFGQT